LFLDEMPEFARQALEVLRQPIEEGAVTVARAARTARFPARFVLVGAMNPCPCGFFGDAVRECRCTPLQIARYRARLSGPLRDRLDLRVEVSALSPEDLSSDASGESSASVQPRVASARDRQCRRYNGESASINAALTPALLARHCRLDSAGARLLRNAAERLALTSRGYDRVRRVARTIADLEGAVDVLADHVAEALQFRVEGG